MNGLTLVIVSVILFLVAYATYGSWLAKKFGIDPSRKTPAHTMNDGVDYVPAKAPVLLGHHFSSIAGAGPIVGPIGAAIFGWIPVFLWIVIGSIFLVVSTIWAPCSLQYVTKANPLAKSLVPQWVKGENNSFQYLLG